MKEACGGVAAFVGPPQTLCTSSFSCRLRLGCNNLNNYASSAIFARSKLSRTLHKFQGW